jgi:hypothetical protein
VQKRHESFQNAGLAAGFVPRGIWIGPVFDGDLTLAVITKTTRLEHCGKANPLDGRFQFAGGCDAGEGGRRYAEPGDEVLFGEPVLRRCQNSRIRENRDPGGKKGCRFSRDIFEFIGDDVDV